MRYIDTAFAHLSFAIKLMQGAEDGLVDLESIDTPLTIKDGASLLVLPDRVLHDRDELINACQNFVTITYGAAAITLNRCREEASVPLPNPIVSECDQWIALVYQARNVFAHDIAEPRWRINPRYGRKYMVGNVQADLRKLDGVVFDYADIGGVDALYNLKAYGEEHAFGRMP
ncbi:MAG: hypothetical protein WD802_00505 [Gemmatimonadaceae bacterium]